MTSRTAASAPETATDTSNWTNWLRTKIVGLVPPGQALPDRQPVYVASWIYVFGVLTLAALVVVLGALKLATPLVVPILLAAFLAIVTGPLMFWLVRKGVQRYVASGELGSGTFVVTMICRLPMPAAPDLTIVSVSISPIAIAFTSGLPE